MVELFTWTLLIGGIVTVMGLGIAYKHLKDKAKNRNERIFWSYKIEKVK